MIGPVTHRCTLAIWGPWTVLITHSYGDHFHLGSLLQLPRDTRIFVTAVESESLFSTYCVPRLTQMGFTRVEPLWWGEERRVGDVTVRALPFHGEQPTDEAGLYPNFFNEGTTWLVRTPGFSAAFFADAGHDVRGDVRGVFRRIRQEGPVDVLFCSVRRFRLKPLSSGSLRWMRSSSTYPWPRSLGPSSSWPGPMKRWSSES